MSKSQKACQLVDIQYHCFNQIACTDHIFFSVLCRSVEDEQAVGATYCENMDDLLRESDFVMLAVSLYPKTTGLISHRELSLMKPTATLVNISRGGGNVFLRLEQETHVIVKIILK